MNRCAWSPHCHRVPKNGKKYCVVHADFAKDAESPPATLAISLHTDDVVRRALNDIVDAWESLKSGDYQIREVEAWLKRDMAPTIQRARKVLGRKRPTA